MNLQEYKCPSCGGALQFNVDAQKLKCTHCDSEYENEALQEHYENIDLTAYEETTLEISSSERENMAEEDIRTYVCNSCGGEIITDATTSATSCPYCDSPVVMTDNFAGCFMPDVVIPFKFDKKAAKEALSNHLKGKKLLPKIFADENHIDEIKGVYVPFWLYDAHTEADIHYEATTVAMWSDTNYDYVKTSHYSLIRSGMIDFADIPVDGSLKMANDLMESIEPFDLSEAVPFNTAYLAGYLADKYDVTEHECSPRADERIRQGTHDAFRSTIGAYNTVITKGSRINIQDGTVRYALYPVWILNTTYQGEKYVFAMNGQTGKFVGNLPVDKGAYFKWLCSLGMGLSGAALAVMYMLSGYIR